MTDNPFYSFIINISSSGRVCKNIGSIEYIQTFVFHLKIEIVKNNESELLRKSIHLNQETSAAKKEDINSLIPKQPICKPGRVGSWTVNKFPTNFATAQGGYPDTHSNQCHLLLPC